jgi:AcrR family transcriptional regulator
VETMSTKAEKNIIDAFLKLYKKRYLNEISVKDICQKADVSRVSFYTYYEDIQSLVSAIEEKALHDATELFKSWPYVDLSKVNKTGLIPMLVDFFTYMHNNTDMFQALFAYHPKSQFIQRYYQLAELSFQESFGIQKGKTFPAETFSAFCVGSLKYAEELWVSGKIKATPEEFALMAQKVIIAILNCDN